MEKASQIINIITKVRGNILEGMENSKKDPQKMFLHLNYALGLLDALSEFYGNSDTNN